MKNVGKFFKTIQKKIYKNKKKFKTKLNKICENSNFFQNKTIQNIG